MVLRHLALISEAHGISLGDLTPVGAALQQQATRDLGPLWNIQATVDCFAALEDVPLGYWPITIKDNLPASAQAGIHEDKDGQPFALVRSSNEWRLSASHEAMEMLVNPSGRQTVAGQSPMLGQGRVDFLVEVCDPCQAINYTINGVPVCDFFTPNYFDPVSSSAVRYSYTGSIKAPRQVLKNGYLSWHDPVSDHFFRASFFGTKPRILDIGKQVPGGNFRTLVYSKTPEAFAARTPNVKTARKLKQVRDATNASSISRAATLRSQIDELVASSG